MELVQIDATIGVALQRRASSRTPNGARRRRATASARDPCNISPLWRNGKGCPERAEAIRFANATIGSAPRQHGPDGAGRPGFHKTSANGRARTAGPRPPKRRRHSLLPRKNSLRIRCSTHKKSLLPAQGIWPQATGIRCRFAANGGVLGRFPYKVPASREFSPPGGAATRAHNRPPRPGSASSQSGFSRARRRGQRGVTCPSQR